MGLNYCSSIFQRDISALKTVVDVVFTVQIYSTTANRVIACKINGAVVNGRYGEWTPELNLTIRRWNIELQFDDFNEGGILLYDRNEVIN